MDLVKKQMLDSFQIYLEKNLNHWRIARISTFVDLIIVEFNQYSKAPSSNHLANITNHLIAAHINLKLGEKSLSDSKPLEEMTYLLKIGESVIEDAFEQIDSDLFEEEFNFFQELNYIRELINLNISSSEIEVDFTQKYFNKLIVFHIKDHFI